MVLCNLHYPLALLESVGGAFVPSSSFETLKCEVQ